MALIKMRDEVNNLWKLIQSASSEAARSALRARYVRALDLYRKQLIMVQS